MQPLDDCRFWTSALTFHTCVMSMLSSTHHLLIASRVKIKKKLESIFEKYNVSKASQESVEEMVKALSKKTFTPDGKTWKMRLADAVLFNESKVTLLAFIYLSVLAVFKKYAMIHKLYYDQIDLFNLFLSYFIKADIMTKCATGRKIVKLKLDDPSDLLSKKNIFICR